MFQPSDRRDEISVALNDRPIVARMYSDTYARCNRASAILGLVAAAVSRARSCVEQRLRDGEGNVARLGTCWIKDFSTLPGSIPAIVVSSQSRRPELHTC
jgi:hypothetical protein